MPDPPTSSSSTPAAAPLVPLRGPERFAGLADVAVLDFWRFAMADLRTNNVRGYLAEFLVAHAVGSTTPRVEWDPWDVTAPDGTRIEVKTSGFVQAWTQLGPSSPAFVVRPSAVWDATTSRRALSRTYNADVYVFCLHTAQRAEDYDVLDVAQWAFYVCSQAELAARLGPTGGRLGLTSLTDLPGPPCGYVDLSGAIARSGSAPS